MLGRFSECALIERVRIAGWQFIYDTNSDVGVRAPLPPLLAHSGTYPLKRAGLVPVLMRKVRDV